MTDKRRKNNKNNRSPRPIWQWYLIGAAIILAIQMFVLPTVKNSSIKEVSYSEFVQKLSSGEIKELKEESYQYLFKTGDKENEKVYRVGKWKDPDITSRLLEAQTKFGTEIVEPTNPVILFLVQLVVPLAIMFLGIRFITKNMMGGSNAMSFGKSNAKIYIQPTNAAKFKDVAGQDEAKESLEEIVDFLHNPKKYAKILAPH